MIKNYLLLLALCYFSAVNSQIVNIPDAKFKAKLVGANATNYVARIIGGGYGKVDINNNGEIEVSEAENVYSLSLQESNIASLQGIESFKNLGVLNCEVNKITTLDLSDLTKLGYLYCQVNQLTTLNIKGLKDIQELICSTNNLQSIDVSELKVLNHLNCSANKLTALILKNGVAESRLYFESNPNLSQICADSAQLTAVQNLMTSYGYTNCSLMSDCSLLNPINIADANFKAKLLSANTTNGIAKDINGNNIKIDTNNSGEIETYEALLVCKLDVSSSIYDTVNDILSLSGIGYFTNLIWLDCSGNSITDLNLTALANLQYLKASSNKISKLNIFGLTNLEYLNLYINSLSSLELVNFLKLKTLELGGNSLITLDLSACQNLESLSICCNPLTNLNISGLNKLSKIYMPQVKISSLDASNLASLTELNCSDNKALTTLNVSGNSNLQRLYCGSTGLNTLNLRGLFNLQTVTAGSCQIANVDFSGLVKLDNVSLNNNLLTEVNFADNPGISYLNLSNNKIEALELVNKVKLIQLIVNNNNLNTLKLSKLDNLSYLKCDNNKLTELDINELKSVRDLYCNANLLTQLFIKNGRTKSNLEFSNNPDLTYICADESQFSVVQSLITIYSYTNCNLNSYCTFIPGEVSYTIQGVTKLDIDNNGCDLQDSKIVNTKFKITNTITDGSIIANNTGSYSIAVQAGTYTITPVIENPNYFTVSPSSVTVDFPVQLSPLNEDFCIVPNGSHSDLEVTLLPSEPARPGFDAKYKIIYKNKGNVAQSGSVNLGFDDSILDFVSSNVAISNQTADNITWDFANLKPFETKEIEIVLNVNTPTDTPAVNNNDILKYTAKINSADTDEMVTDNTFEFNQTVVGSYDPNDKTCLEGDVITPALIGEYVHYMIRFENTGNYAAENIVVKDMIDLSKFDITTLVSTSASHSYITKISDDNKVEFIFENINLPFNDANNDGYIAFKIKTLPTLAVGDSFTNEANIYFDYNFPILTNTAKSTFNSLSTQDFEFSNYFTVYPNPMSEVLNITTKNAIEVKSISIYNILGQLVIVIPNAANTSSIDISKLNIGTYFLSIKSEKGTSSMKLIKK